MGFVNDLTGQRFGKLVVLERAGSSKHSKATWLCICDCGSETIVVGNNLQNQTRSCGCSQYTGTYSIRERAIRLHSQSPRQGKLVLTPRNPNWSATDRA